MDRTARNAWDGRTERRRYPRVDVALEGTLRSAGVKVRCRIHNISAGGALVEADAWLRIGDRVTLEVDDLGDMLGRVVRVSSTAAGIAFEGVEAAADTFVGEWCTLEPAGSDTARPQAMPGRTRQAV